MKFVKARSSEITHIIDTIVREKYIHENYVFTKCGRKLVNFWLGSEGEKDCPKCGEPADYLVIREEIREQKRIWKQKRIEADKLRKKRNAKRLLRHRKIMKDLAVLLSEYGGLISNVRELEAGGSLEVEIEELKFKLSGDIWEKEQAR